MKERAMSFQPDRRRLLGFGAGMAALSALGVPRSVLAQAASGGELAIAYPADVPTWDPNARTFPAGFSLYLTVFDQPLRQSPTLEVLPGLVTKWGYVDDKGLALGLDLRADAVFHDGSPFTAEDIRYTYFERPHAPVAEGQRKLDTAFIWRKVRDIEVISPTRAVMHFSEPMPTAISWLYFLASFVVPKQALETMGIDAFAKKPVGSGPYKVVEYQQGARMVLEAHDRYWGGKPKIGRVTIDIVRDQNARTAAIESRRASMSIDVPIREAERLGKVPGLATSIDPITDITILQVTKNGGFADQKVRLAAHHAINKAALSKAFFVGAAVPISVPAAKGTPGYPADYEFAYSEDKAKALLKEAGYGPDKPVSITLSTTNGVNPGDFDVARAIVQMWKKIGINAELETIELSTYQERLRAGALKEATLYSWGNTAGDPEFYAGYLLDPKSIFSAFKSDDLGQMIHPLLVEVDEAKRVAGYKAVNRFAAEQGYTIPLYQSVKTIAHTDKVATTKYANGLTLPSTYTLKG